jgi:hypothetical protein
MIPNIRPFSDIQRVTATAVVTTLESAPVPKGNVFIAFAVMAKDETTAIPTSLHIGIKDGSALFPLSSFAGAIDAEDGLYNIGFWFLSEGQQIYAKFTTPTAGDKLLLTTNGVLIPMCDRGHS